MSKPHPVFPSADLCTSQWLLSPTEYQQLTARTVDLPLRKVCGNLSMHLDFVIKGMPFSSLQSHICCLCRPKWLRNSSMSCEEAERLRESYMYPLLRVSTLPGPCQGVPRATRKWSTALAARASDSSTAVARRACCHGSLTAHPRRAGVPGTPPAPPLRLSRGTPAPVSTQIQAFLQVNGGCCRQMAWMMSMADMSHHDSPLCLM